DLVHDAQPQRHKRVEATAQFSHQAGANEQLVRGDLGVGRALLERGNEKLGPAFHAVGRLTKPEHPPPAMEKPVTCHLSSFPAGSATARTDRVRAHWTLDIGRGTLEIPLPHVRS